MAMEIRILAWIRHTHLTVLRRLICRQIHEHFPLASSTTKTGRHDIAEILLKVALNTKNKKINQLFYCQYQKEEGNCSL
jgi:hypothetical protein